jgi:hypothetical protein
MEERVLFYLRMRYRWLDMFQHEIKDLGIHEPNLLAIVKTDDMHYAFPVRKETLAHHSTVFADMLSLSKDEDEDDMEDNGWPEPYHRLDVVTLDDVEDDIENVFRHIFPECLLPDDLSHVETVGVYKVADKYGMQRLCDWMYDKMAT